MKLYSILFLLLFSIMAYAKKEVPGCPSEISGTFLCPQGEGQPDLEVTIHALSDDIGGGVELWIYKYYYPWTTYLPDYTKATVDGYNFTDAYGENLWGWCGSDGKLGLSYTNNENDIFQVTKIVDDNLTVWDWSGANSTSPVLLQECYPL